MANFSSLLKNRIPAAAAALGMIGLAAIDLRLQQSGQKELGGLSGLAFRNMGHPEKMKKGHPEIHQDLSSLKVPAGGRR